MNYWNARIINRRAALRAAAASGAGLAALSLAGCGGGSGSGSSETKKPGESQVIDSTKGKPGGTLKITIEGYPANFDTIGTTISYNPTGFVYTGLLAHAYGTAGVKPQDYYTYDAEIAQALPEQPDETTFVFKLRPNVKFTNGRQVTSEDVRYTFDRIVNYDRSIYRATVGTWLDRIETPDPQTAVVKTKFPYADTLVSFAAATYGFIIAKEHAEGSDALSTMMGTGPYMLADTTRPVSFRFKRNPDYHQKPYPYFDFIEAYIAPDAVKRIADFTTRQVHLSFEHSPTERDQIKQQRPDAMTETYESTGGSVIMRSDQAPFNDKRMRQALSMALDRKKLNQVSSNGEGRPDQNFSLAYQSLFDFREPKDLGAAAKYWEFNPAEAKKLFAAAGHDKPIEAPMSHFDSAVQGQWFVDLATLIQAQWREAGIANIKDQTLTQAQSSATVQQGNYEGMALQPSGFSGAPAFALVIRNQYYMGPNYTDRPNTNVCWVNNPQLRDLGEKQMRQIKFDDRKQTYREMENLVAEEQYRLSTNTGIKTVFWDPSIQNVSIPSQYSSAKRYMMKWWFA